MQGKAEGRKIVVGENRELIRVLVGQREQLKRGKKYRIRWWWLSNGVLSYSTSEGRVGLSKMTLEQFLDWAGSETLGRGILGALRGVHV